MWECFQSCSSSSSSSSHHALAATLRANRLGVGFHGLSVWSKVDLDLRHSVSPFNIVQPLDQITLLLIVASGLLVSVVACWICSAISQAFDATLATLVTSQSLALHFIAIYHLAYAATGVVIRASWKCLGILLESTTSTSPLFFFVFSPSVISSAHHRQRIQPCLSRFPSLVQARS